VKPLTRGLPPPDPHSLFPLSSAEFVETPTPKKILGTLLIRCHCDSVCQCCSVCCSAPYSCVDILMSPARCWQNVQTKAECGWLPVLLS
jgi:hypothetical protein